MTQSAINHVAGVQAEIVRKIDDGVFEYGEFFPDSERGASVKARGSRVHIGTLLQRQLEKYQHRAAQGSLSPSTLSGYRKAIQSDRMAFWAEMPLFATTPSILREWVVSLDLTATFARNLMTPLRSVFEDALNDELIKVNPFDRIALAKLLKESTLASEYVVDPFTADERQALLGAARTDERPMVQFWFATGLRTGELIALKWPRINDASAVAMVNLNQVEGIEKPPKTAAGVRDVDLKADALAALAAQRLLYPKATANVWLNPRTGEPWTTDAQIRKTLWEPLCKRAEVRYRNPYQARHTFASTLLTAGANPWYVAQQLGHRDVQMVFRVYGKFIAADYLAPKLKDASS